MLISPLYLADRKWDENIVAWAYFSGSPYIGLMVDKATKLR